MNKLFSLLRLTVFVLVFTGCEYLIHYTEGLLNLGTVAYIFFRIIEVICGLGAVIETIEIVFEVEIKKELRNSFNDWCNSEKDR
jgi:hypothetical protein